MSKQLFIGLMSGTSMDGIDAVVVDFAKQSPKVIATHLHKIPDQILADLRQLCLNGAGVHEINMMAATDRQLGLVFAKATQTLLKKANLSPNEIIAVGSHGQTIRHHPDHQLGFTTQIGDPNTIASTTGIDVVADFRRKDIALGGQGAPLVPAFHHAVFSSKKADRVILNIGGMANITYLPADQTKPVIGLDTGPGNILLDEWCRSATKQRFDKNGKFAKSGVANEKLLKHFLNFDYFRALPPKSTGREVFNLTWIENQLAKFSEKIIEADVQATLVELTAKSIALEVMHLAEKGELYVCGGGTHNPEVMRTLNLFLPQYSVATTEDLGIQPDWVEAAAFAWLAYAHINKQPGNLPAVTGASKPAVLGGYYPHQ